MECILCVHNASPHRVHNRWRYMQALLPCLQISPCPFAVQELTTQVTIHHNTIIITSDFITVLMSMITWLLSIFDLPLNSSASAGDVRNFSRWKNTLAHMDKGRYAADTVLDYLQNKDNKALVFTDKHLVYLNLKRQRLRWALPVADLSSVTTHGM